MKQIHLYNEVTQTTTVAKVTEKQYNLLDNLVYNKGYKMFGLSIYDNIKRCKPTNTITLEFLEDIGIKDFEILKHFY